MRSRYQQLSKPIKLFFTIGIQCAVSLLYAHEDQASDDYQVSVDGKPVFVHQARVSAAPINQVWPGYQRPLEQTELASFCSFDGNRPAVVKVVSRIAVEHVTIRPFSYGIEPVVSGDTICFTVEKPGNLIVEVNGLHHALHIFLNPMEKMVKPQKGADDLIYFAPGVHHVGAIRPENGQRIYIDEGAVVHGYIEAIGKKDIQIFGRGILDGSTFGRFDIKNLIHLYNCENVSVEGIILRDPPTWGLVVIESENIRIDRVKLIGFWRYNTDGIDIVNSRHIRIDNSFVRSFDDAIALKGTRYFGGPEGDLFNIRVENCVLWSDWGRALEIGAETVADAIHDVRFSNCDIVHFVHIALDIQNGDRADIHDILFEDIRIEDPIFENAYFDNAENPIKDFSSALENRPVLVYKPSDLGRLIELNIAENQYSLDSRRGKIRNVVFKDIFYSGNHLSESPLLGLSEDSLIEGVIFDNLVLDGKRVRSLEAGNFVTNGFTRKVIFR